MPCQKLLTLLACIVCLLPSLSIARTIELEVRNAAAGSPVFVKGGVTFANGELKNTRSLRLSGQALLDPALTQFDVLSRWPDGSLKSVLVSTLLEPATGKSTLQLAVEQAPQAIAAGSLVQSETASSIVIHTGPLKLIVSKEQFTVLEGVWRDLNADGQFTPDEQLAGPGEIFLIDANDDQVYRSSLDGKPRVSIEESGPLRTVIKAEGNMLSHSARSLTDFLVRIYAYARSDQVDIEYTLIDRRDDGDAREVSRKLPLAVKEYGLRFTHELANPQFYFGGDKNKVHYGQVKGEHYLFQNGQLNFIDGSLQPRDTFSTRYNGVAEGYRASGWLAVNDGRAGMAALVKDFWQEFPNELAVTPEHLLIRLHPARATGDKPDTHEVKLSSESKRYERPNTLYSPQEGMAKTSRIRLLFNRGKLPAKAIVANNRHFQQHAPLLIADALTYTESGVFGDVSPSNSYTRRYDNYLMSHIYEPSFQEGKRPVMYGWRDYGDRMVHGWIDVENGVRIPGFYNDAHVGSNPFFLQYIRTGDVRWWHTAAIATHHFIDIDVSHGRRFGRHSNKKGQMIWTPPGESMLITHTNYDHTGRGVHLGHAHVSGMTNYYLLTGDKRTKDVLDLTADWWRFMAPIAFPTPRPADPDSGRLWAEAERDFGWPLYVANEVVRVSSDPQYHKEVGAQIVRHLIEWWKTPGKHEINGRILGRNDASKGTGWWEMDDMNNGDGNGTNPWMAGALFSALIQFYQHDQLMPSGIDHAELKDMMWQCLNYVVKYGWNEEKKFFAYSESQPDADGGSEHLLYSLVYLHQLLEQNIKDGKVANAHWYDTSDKWLDIARQQSKRFRSGWIGGEQDYGFYGLEMVFPMDFFNVMQAADKR